MSGYYDIDETDVPAQPPKQSPWVTLVAFLAAMMALLSLITRISAMGGAEDDPILLLRLLLVCSSATAAVLGLITVLAWPRSHHPIKALLFSWVCLASFGSALVGITG